MSKEENKEPLLPKSPPSPIHESRWLDMASSNTKIVIIHHWSEYDQGSHKSHEIEITSSNRVLEIILLAVRQFYPIGEDPSQFLLRIADKNGKPKTSMPTLDVGQCIFDTGIVRFALCQKQQDQRRSEKFDKFEEKSPTEITEPPRIISQNDPKVVNLEQKSKTMPKKNKFCCCFYSE